MAKALFKRLPGEIWKITRYDGYAVSTYGRVASCWRRGGNVPTKTKWQLKKPSRIGKDQYQAIVIKVSGRRTIVLVHRLVLETFVGPCPIGMECAHYPDKDPRNNRLDNLRWASHSENERDKRR